MPRLSIKDRITIKSPAFSDNGTMPTRYTGHGEDISPAFHLHGLSKDAVSIAIVMDDLDHPIQDFNHWIIWNIPAREKIPGRIPPGPTVEKLGGAVQGVAYGKNRYRGPKMPLFKKGSKHYMFYIYVLDTMLTLDSKAKKKELNDAIQGHILQYGYMTCSYSNAKK